MDPNTQQPQIIVPQEIIQHYAKYRSKNTNLKIKEIGQTQFEVDERYEILEQIGQGAYGVVVAAKDRKAPRDKRLVAIKKVQIAFEHKLYTKRTLRELKLQRLVQHDNILGVNTLLLPKSREDFNYIYIVTELMETDLYQIIKSDQPLSDDHCQFFIYQVLRGLKYLHSANVVHRDLKPRNLLVNKNCDLRICDLGLARAIIPQEGQRTGRLTDYIVTRWYRAPELLLSYREYDSAVDIWSVGCILAELLNRKTFLRGNSTKHQLELIFEHMGTPSEQEIAQIPKPKYRELVRHMPKRTGKPWEKMFSKSSPVAIDLLKKLLTFDPKKRLTAEQALQHPYLADFHLPEDEPTTTSVNRLDFEFDEYNLNKHQLKDLIYEEILLYYYPEFKQQYEQKKKNGQSVIQHILTNANSKIPDEDSDEEESD